MYGGLRTSVASCVLLLLSCGLAWGQEYAIEDLGALGPAASAAPAINRHGEVAFTGYPGGGPYRACLWLPKPAYGLPGGLNDLGTLGGTFSEAYDINDRGQVVGDAELAFTYIHAFLWDSTSDTMIDLHKEPEQANWSYARGINNHGDVVGFGDIDYPDGLHMRAMLWRDGTVTDLGTLGGEDSRAFDINDAGQVIGYAETVSEPHVFLWLMQDHPDPGLNLPQGIHDTNLEANDSSSMTWGPFALNNTTQMVGSVLNDDPQLSAFLRESPMAGSGVTYLAPPLSRANGINNRGQIVGLASYEDGWRAVLWQNGEMINLNTYLEPESDWILINAADINDRGQIVGYGWNEQAGTRVFLMTPADEDGDGLFDIWESQGGGIDANNDDIIDLDLHALGARPDHKDVFVEVDAMTDLAPTNISPIPDVVNAGLDTGTSLDMVIEAFLNAEVDNPDGQNGIRLHIQVDETNLTKEPWPNAWTQYNAARQDHFGTMGQRADANAAHILAAKKLTYRYCIFAQQYGGSTSSGLAELPGDDFLVSLGHPDWLAIGVDAEHQAGTFMHEMGHTLGLHHGGTDDINYKPNYKSTMSYAWQLERDFNALFWELDYSTQKLPLLKEQDLDETAGLGAAPGTYTGVLVPFGWVQNPGDTPTVKYASLAGGDAVDWNDDSDTMDNGVMMDISYFDTSSQSASAGQELSGHQDWDNLLYALAGGVNYSDGAQAATTMDTEMTVETFIALGELPAPGECPGDINDDATVDILDLLSMLGDWGPCPEPPAQCPADIDGPGGDGAVAIDDLLLLLASWGDCN